MVVALAFGAANATAGEKEMPNCPVMDEPINLAVSTPTDDGPVFFCCKGCIKEYNKNSSKFAAKVSSQRKLLAKWDKVQVKCPVTGEAVNPELVTKYNGEKVALCCKRCVSALNSSGGKYKAALANSYTYQTKCPVSGSAIDPTVSNELPGGETVYFCCGGCSDKFMANPDKYAPKLAEQGVKVSVAKIKAAAESGAKGGK